MGTVNASPAGGTEAVAGAPALGRSAIGPVGASSLDGCPSRLAARIEDGRLTALIGRDHARRLSRICQLTVVACELAVRDAGMAGGAGLGIGGGPRHGRFPPHEGVPPGLFPPGPSRPPPPLFPHPLIDTQAAAG